MLGDPQLDVLLQGITQVRAIHRQALWLAEMLLTGG